MKPYRTVSVNISLNNVPKRLHTTRCLVFAHTTPIFSLINDPMNVKLLAIIVATPEISEHFSAFLNTVSYHLRASHFSTVFHHESPDVFSSSFIESKHPYFLILSAFAMVRKLRLIYFNSTAHLAKLVPAVVVLKVNMDQLANPTIYIVNVAILQTFESEFCQISIGLQRIKPPDEVIKNDS